MTISAVQFVADFPEFANASAYPASQINYWMNLAYVMTNSVRWPTRAGPGAPAQGSFVFDGNPLPGDTVDLNGSAVTFVSASPTGLQSQIGPTPAATLANLLAVLSLSTDANVVKFSYLITGGLTLTAIAQQPGVAGNALTISAASAAITASGPTLTGGAAGRALLDIGVELFTAHHLVLEYQAGQEAAVGAPPGRSKGPISGTSAVGASVSYDTGSGLNPGDGHWNLTTYGTRFLEMLRLVGVGPIQVGVGRAPIGTPGAGYGAGGAWAGPGWFGAGGTGIGIIRGGSS